MLILKLTIYFLSMILPGYLILSLILKNQRQDFWLKLGLSYGMGSFFITMQLFLYLFILRLNFSILVFGIILLLETILLAYYAYKSGVLKNIKAAPFSFVRGLGTKEVIIILLILIQLIFIFSNAISRPIITYDSVAMWSFRAKVLYYENIVDSNTENLLYLGEAKWHNNYPWHVPLTQFWMAKVLGEFNDLLINFIFVFYFISILILIYYFLREYLYRFRSLVFVFLVSTMPFFFYHSYNAYADLVLSFYILAAFMYVIKWFVGRDSKMLTLSSIFAGMSLFIKIDAIIFIFSILILMVYYLVREKFNKGIIIKVMHYFLIILLLISPFIVYMIINDMSIKNYEESGLVFHPEVLKNLANVLFVSNNWNIWWFIVIISFIININRIFKERELLLIWLFLFSSFFCFIILYIFTLEFQFVLNYTAVSRNIITLIPISVLAVALLYKSEIINL